MTLQISEKDGQALTRDFYHFNAINIDLNIFYIGGQ